MLCLIALPLLILNLILANPVPSDSNNLKTQIEPFASQENSDIGDPISLNYSDANDDPKCTSDTSTDNRVVDHGDDSPDWNIVRRKSSTVCPNVFPIPVIITPDTPTIENQPPHTFTSPNHGRNGKQKHSCTKSEKSHYLSCGGPEVIIGKLISFVVNCVRGKSYFRWSSIVYCSMVIFRMERRYTSTSKSTNQR